MTCFRLLRISYNWSCPSPNLFALLWRWYYNIHSTILTALSSLILHDDWRVHLFWLIINIYLHQGNSRMQEVAILKKHEASTNHSKKAAWSKQASDSAKVEVTEWAVHRLSHAALGQQVRQTFSDKKWAVLRLMCDIQGVFHHPFVFPLMIVFSPPGRVSHVVTSKDPTWLAFSGLRWRIQVSENVNRLDLKVSWNI